MLAFLLATQRRSSVLSTNYTFSFHRAQIPSYSYNRISFLLTQYTQNALSFLLHRTYSFFFYHSTQYPFLLIAQNSFCPPYHTTCIFSTYRTVSFLLATQNFSFLLITRPGFILLTSQSFFLPHLPHNSCLSSLYKTQFPSSLRHTTQLPYFKQRKYSCLTCFPPYHMIKFQLCSQHNTETFLITQGFLLPNGTVFNLVITTTYFLLATQIRLFLNLPINTALFRPYQKKKFLLTTQHSFLPPLIGSEQKSPSFKLAI
jgi:hypothetical protein